MARAAPLNRSAVGGHRHSLVDLFDRRFAPPAQAQDQRDSGRAREQQSAWFRDLIDLEVDHVDVTVVRRPGRTRVQDVDQDGTGADGKCAARA